MKQWLTYTVTSAALGLVFGYVLLWAWFLFSGIVLGYGDRGPYWLNIVNDVVLYGGIASGIVGGQLFFIFRKDK